MQKETHHLKQLFQRIFGGTATQKEKEQVSKWLSRLDVSDQEPSFEAIERQRLRFQQAFYEHLDRKNGRTRNKRLYYWIPAAAAAILIAVGGMFFLQTPKTRSIAYAEAFTRAGERKIITLSDGTTVTLNNASKIKFPQEFNGKLREVYLEGEAFFAVKHDQHKPFIVNSGNLKVNVLGTSFDVQNYTNDHQIAVTVASGKVGVVAKGDRTAHLLTPGMQLAYHPKTGKFDQLNVNPDDFTGWQQGELIFKHEQLAIVCQRLERWYGVKINIKSKSLENARINLDQKNESLGNVMQMLGIVGGFNYEISDKQVVISKRKENMK